MTTLHLGDCLNGCAICADRYHDGQAICDTCGKEAKMIDIYDPKCCEESNLHEYDDDCDCCINVCRDCAEPMDKWNPMKEEAK